MIVDCMVFPVAIQYASLHAAVEHVSPPPPPPKRDNQIQIRVVPTQGMCRSQTHTIRDMSEIGHMSQSVSHCGQLLDKAEGTGHTVW